MAWFFYHQQTPESEWLIADARDRQQIVNDTQPPFTTILDLNTEIVDGMSREDMDDTHYRGDLYFDFDSEDIEDCTKHFNRFLSKLSELEVDLRQIELYASGGKGFHVVVPARIYLDNPSSGGYKFLPQTFKEMAQQLYVECMDMRVYSARKGRMFRTANVLRPNGKYKVPLSVQEARTMTQEMYDTLTTSARQPFQIEAPVFNGTLARMFADARRKVQDGMKKRRNSQVDQRLVAQFGSELPASVKLIAQGSSLKDGIGFQQLATQIGITANALNMTEEATLLECADLIANHVSDGFRYNTPDKRRRELSRMYHYMKDNPCYEFSIGAIKNCLEAGTPTPDLVPPIEDPYGALAQDEDLDLEDDDIFKGVRFNQEGIFLRVWDKDTKEHRIRRASEVGIDDVALLQTLESREHVGFEYSAFLNGVPRGKRRIGISEISTQSSLQTAMGNPESSAIHLTDPQAKALLGLLRRKAEVENNVVTTVPREGVDVIPLPDTDTEIDRHEIIYAGPNNLGVLTPPGSTGKYRLQTGTGQDGEFKSDLISAPALEGTADEKVFFEHFFNAQPIDIVARTAGYYFACFLAQPLRKVFVQFPMLQVYGDSGSGKTSYNLLCAHLHFYNKQPQAWASNSVTPFALTTMLQGSGSIPIVFDELKVSELGIRKVHEFLMIMRNNYTGNASSRGQVTRDSGTGSTLGITRTASVAPLVFLTEQMEIQTAIVDRAVNVAMRERVDVNTGLHTASYNYSHRRRKTLGQLGHLCVRKALTLDLDKMTEQIDQYKTQVSEVAPPGTGERPVYNNAVVLLGLEFGRATMSSVYGDHFNELFENLKTEILTNVHVSMVENMSEASKALHTIAHMSGMDTANPLSLIIGTDYMPAIDSVTNEACVDLHLRNVWDKYSRLKRSQGEAPLYPNEGAFIAAITRHRTVVDTVCSDSALKGGRPSVRVTRHNLRLLLEDRIEEFSRLEAEMN